VARDELGGGPPRAGVGGLHRSEQLLFELVGEVRVHLLVRLTQIVERQADLACS
jgi:hypothetical protein